MSDLASRLSTSLEGRYAIEGEVGQGGMATVFLALDAKHKRKVALKVLKPELSAVVGAERFLGEIETTANLHHPHILPLFDSGEADGLLFYVMPYVEGETLRERLEREGQLPVDEAVSIATAVASALDHAHRHGVVHRDVKPANILLQDGQPVVSDFGIALAVGAAGGSRLTETGLSVGTPYYMSPEQATGDQVVGPPSDTYALAAVLYEMLVGEPPYLGRTAQAVLGKILQGEAVSASAVRRSIPANVDAAIRKALEKLPADRFATTADFAAALADPGFRHGIGGAAAPPASPASIVARWSGWAVAAVLAGIVLFSSREGEQALQATRFAIPMSDGSVFSQGATLLPDGSGMVYVRPTAEGRQMVWIRHWDELDGSPIAGTEGGRADGGIGISPDGTRVSFSAGFPGPLRVAPVLGGAVRTLADMAYGGGMWSPDGTTLYYITGRGGLASRSVDGVGEPRQIFPDQFPDSVAAGYQVIPGTDVLLFRHFSLSQNRESSIKALDLRSGDVTIIVRATGPAYVTPDGDLTYGTEDGSIMAAPFDVETRAIGGAPAVVETGLATDVFRHAWYSLAQDGSLLFHPGASISSGTPVWVQRNGSYTSVEPDWSITTNSTNSSVSLSPSGDRMALSIGGEGYNLYIKRIPGGPLTRIPSVGGVVNRRASWSADGRTVYFIGGTAGASSSVWSMPADGSGAPREVLTDERGIYEAFMAPGGEWLVYRVGTNTGAEGDDDIMGLRVGVDDEAKPLVDTDGLDRQPAVSPNGRWLAYESNQSGQFEVYVRPFPETGAWREQVSISGGSEPVWSRDGRELFYRGPTHYVSVQVAGDDHIEVVGRRELFPAEPFMRGAGHPLYDVSPAGDRFLMILQGAATASPALLTRNWSQALAKRLGG